MSFLGKRVELSPSINLQFLEERNCVILMFVSLMPITVPGIKPGTERHFTFTVVSHIVS